MRSGLTGLAVMVLVTIYSFAVTIATTVGDLINTHASETRLIVRERWVVPGQFPLRFVPRIAAVDGVDDWTVWHYYLGKIDEMGMPLVGFATRIDNIREMHPGLESLDAKVIEAMGREMTATLMGERTMEQMGWRVGQVFTAASLSHPGKNLQFRIVGTLPADQWPFNFFFREDYYQNAVGDTENVSVMWLKVRDATTGNRVARAVEHEFRNPPYQLRVKTEAASPATSSCSAVETPTKSTAAWSWTPSAAWRRRTASRGGTTAGCWPAGSSTS